MVVMLVNDSCLFDACLMHVHWNTFFACGIIGTQKFVIAIIVSSIGLGVNQYVS